MEPRTPSEPADAGTLPVHGTGILPVAGDVPAASERPSWVNEARTALTEPGRYLAYEDPANGEKVVAMSREWTRIGRSLQADIRFDDATVSRRHALIVVGNDGVRVLDDRSLNGVHVNGRRVEWSALKDGDEIVVGRHRLYYIDTTATAAASSPAQPAAIAE